MVSGFSAWKFTEDLLLPDVLQPNHSHFSSCDRASGYAANLGHESRFAFSQCTDV